MGNTIFIKDRRVCIKPMQSRLKAIQKVKPPMTLKGHRSSAEFPDYILPRVTNIIETNL